MSSVSTGLPINLSFDSNQGNCDDNRSFVKEIIFVGTGTSGCVPNACCLTRIQHNDLERCYVCEDAFLNPQSKNRRNNTGILLRISSPKHKKDRLLNVLIDCGKTFHLQSILLCGHYQIRHLDAVILTHSHADAVFGLDDLRQWTLGGIVQDHVDIYLNHDTMALVKRAFPYLVDLKQASGGGDVSSLRYHFFEKKSSDPSGFFYDEIELFGIKIQPFDVEHGKYQGNPFMCLGFQIDNKITYMSDVSRIPDSVLPILQNQNIIIIDALHDKRHPSHFCIEEALEALEMFKPKLGLLTGFSHRVDHHKEQSKIDEKLGGNNFPTNEWLFDSNSQSTVVKLAWDLLCLRIN